MNLSEMSSRPSWLTVKVRPGPDFTKVAGVFKQNRLETVCQRSGCPNLWECFSKREATIMIMGAVCTRACAYCRINPGKPQAIDGGEPARVAQAITELGLDDIVLTSPSRDDLPDGGAGVFEQTIKEIKAGAPGCRIEVLVPDLRGDWPALAKIIAAEPKVIGHNIETVARLFPSVRPQADYRLSLALLKRLAVGGAAAKSALMVGLGESRAEIRRTLEDIAASGVKAVTIGQYLAPSPAHWPVHRYYRPAEFMGLAKYAQRLGFKRVISGPLARSSSRGPWFNQLSEAECSS